MIIFGSYWFLNQVEVNIRRRIIKMVSKYYYRYNNDGDSYEDCQEHWGFPDICKIKDINNKVLDKLILFMP